MAPQRLTRAEVRRGILRGCLAAIAYFVAARLGYAFAIPHGIVTLWPPSGVMLALLLLSHKREWPFLIAGGLTGSVFSDALSGYSLWLAAAAAIANESESLLAAWVLTRLSERPSSLTTLRAVLSLTIGAAICSNALTAVLGAAVLRSGFQMPFGIGWFVWWVGDGLGMLIVAPAILAWASVTHVAFAGGGRLIELPMLAASLIATARLGLGPRHAWTVQPGPYITLPVLVWAALRFGPIGAATTSLVLAGTATWYAALGVGPFAAAPTGIGAALSVYAYLGLASFLSMVLAAVFAERTAAGEELRRSTERYRNVVETATDAIVTIDRDGRILFTNSATERIFGYPADELAGRNLTMLMPSRLRERHTASMARYLATGRRNVSWQAVPLTGLHKDGREIPLEVSFGELVEPNRHLFTGILRDISDKQAAEDALGALEAQYRESQRMEAVGQLAGGVAHDFNNLLTVIQGYCELLREELDPASPHGRDLAEIQRAADSATALTRQLLAFSRRQILEPRVLNLADSLLAIEPILKRLIGEDIEVIIRAPDDVGHVRADPGQIEQVVMNLAINARDAMPSGGTLTIELCDVVLDESYTRHHIGAVPGRYVMLAVSDTGIGMDNTTAVRVFEPFFTTKPKGRGTGLGLSTVHGIVKQSGGNIGVYSEPGHGTTFKVYLPRVDAPVEAMPRAVEGSSGDGWETVLLLEDEAAVRALAQRILTQHGYRVLVAATPAEALSIAAQFNGEIHLLLSDLVLPETSGRVVADTLRAGRRNLRVLFMSGYTDDAIARRGVLDREAPFIQKPFTPEALLRKVRGVLDPAAPPPAAE